MQNKLVALTERQHRLLPILAACYEMPSTTAAVRAAVDAMIATCAENDSLFASAVKLSDERSQERLTSGLLPERVKVPVNA